MYNVFNCTVSVTFDQVPVNVASSYHLSVLPPFGNLMPPPPKDVKPPGFIFILLALFDSSS